MIEIKKCDYDAYELPINQIQYNQTVAIFYYKKSLYVVCVSKMWHYKQEKSIL